MKIYKNDESGDSGDGSLIDGVIEIGGVNHHKGQTTATIATKKILKNQQK